MTYDNIKHDVLSLGFTDTLEDEGQFLLALNRAQNLLANEFPKKKTLLLSRAYRKPKATFTDALTQKISLKIGEGIAFLYRLSDGAVCFGNKVLPLTEGAGTYKFIAERDGIFTLEGDATMFAIAIYDEGTPLSLCEVDLPYAEYEIGRYDRGVRRISLPPTTTLVLSSLALKLRDLPFAFRENSRAFFLSSTKNRHRKSPRRVRRLRWKRDFSRYFLFWYAHTSGLKMSRNGRNTTWHSIARGASGCEMRQHLIPSQLTWIC
ncbi:MAG: hypothetical protein IKC72_04405 [Clostridia bacterium]|nr:hypothetical protein [Clostridia bacterium]